MVMLFDQRANAAGADCLSRSTWKILEVSGFEKNPHLLYLPSTHEHLIKGEGTGHEQ